MSVQSCSSRTVLWDYSDLNFAGDTMLSGHPDYEPLKEQYGKIGAHPMDCF